MKRVNFKKYVINDSDVENTYIKVTCTCEILLRNKFNIEKYRKVLAITFNETPEFFMRLPIGYICMMTTSEKALLRYLLLEAYQEMILNNEV